MANRKIMHYACRLQLVNSPYLCIGEDILTIERMGILWYIPKKVEISTYSILLVGSVTILRSKRIDKEDQFTYLLKSTKQKHWH